MTEQSKNSKLPIWCEECDVQGEFFTEDFNEPHFVICNECDSEFSSVWCEKCGMGGEFVRKLVERPGFWICMDCGTKYDLPDDFYENPKELILWEKPKKNPEDQNIPLRNFLKYAVRFLAGMLTLYGISGFFTGEVYFPGVGSAVRISGDHLIYIALGSLLTSFGLTLFTIEDRGKKYGDINRIAFRVLIFGLGIILMVVQVNLYPIK